MRAPPGQNIVPWYNLLIESYEAVTNEVYKSHLVLKNLPILLPISCSDLPISPDIFSLKSRISRYFGIFTWNVWLHRYAYLYNASLIFIT